METRGQGLAPIIGSGRHFSAVMEELAAVIRGLERDECLPVLMNARLFQPLYEIVKADAGAHAERVMVRLMAAACTDMGALRNDVPVQPDLRSQIAEARGAWAPTLAGYAPRLVDGRGCG